MITHRLLPSLALICGLTLGGLPSASAAPGSNDPLFDTLLGANDVQALVVQPDGMILAGGRISSADSLPVEGLVRLYPDGTVDSSFNPDASLGPLGMGIYLVDCLRLQKDGKILAMGWFSSNSGIAPEVVRFHPDGTVDTTFSMTTGGFAETMELLPDGKILVGGGSLWIGEDPSARYLVRLNPDGSLDETFPVAFNYEVKALEVLDDGRVMVGGNFTDAGGTTMDYLVRLEADGSLDTTYNANATSGVLHLLAQPDGKLLFSSVNSSGDVLVRRLFADGSSDATFATTTLQGFAALASLQLQADGKIVIGGKFSTVNGSARQGLVRLQANGALDTTFVNSGTNEFQNGTTVAQADGKILVGGGFSSLGGADTGILARLQNDAATSSFVKNATTLTWLRGGGSNEVGNVVFETYDGTGNQWLPLGNGTRVAGGWSVPAAGLAANGIVRARGAGRVGRGSFADVRELFAFGTVAPAIRVDSPAGTALANGAAVDAGSVLDGYSTVKRLRIGNTGTGVLDGLSLAITGPHASQFKVVEFSPHQLSPQAGLPFGIRFSPVGTGARSAVLTISSNSPGGTFTVNLTGTGSTVFSPFFASPTDVPLQAINVTATGKTFGTLGLGFAPAAGTVLTAINQLHYNDPIAGEFSDLPDGSLVSATYAGQTYVFLAGYRGGTANDFTLTLLGPGVPRRDFVTTLDDFPASIAVGKDRRIMAMGSSYYFPRLLKDDGTRIASFPPPFYRGTSNGSANDAVTCPDGKFLVAGNFDKVGKLPRRNLVRFHANGDIDPSFNANLADEWVDSLAVQMDGKILLAGGSSTNSLVRLNPDGSVDPSFSVTLDGNVTVLSELSDGKVLIVGSFGTVNGTTKQWVARLHHDGSLDPTFSYPAEAYFDVIGSFAEQRDGKLVVAHRAGVTAGKLRRIHTDGSFDPSFMPDFGASADFDGISIQTDSKIVVSGNFAEVNGKARRGLVRLNPDGTVDPSFGGTSFGASCLAALGNGEFFIGGGIVSGATYPGMARLMNGPAVTTLEVPNFSTVRLMTSGAAPELKGATFDVLPSGAPAWIPLNRPARIAGGWSLSGQSLPTAGIIRWRSFPSSHSDSSSVIEGFKNFGSAAPHVVLTGPAGNVLANGVGGIDFGPVLTGHSRVLKFRVTNQGDGGWEDFATAISGTNAGSYSVVSVPERMVLPGETGVFEVRFTPSAVGIESGVLTLTSNSPAGAFVVPLTGNGGTVFSPVFHEAGDVVLTADSFTANIRTFGTLGLTFAPATGTKLLAVQNTGEAAILGRFTDLPDGGIVSATFGGTTYHFIAGYAGGDGNDLVLSLVGPGVLDLAMHPMTLATPPSVAIPLTDGSALIGGTFTTVNFNTRNRLARLDPDGMVNGYHPDLDGTVEAIHRFASGETIIAGDFTKVGGLTAGRVSKLRADGSLDPFFLVAPNAIVRAVVVQPDDKILIGGDFTFVNGVARNRIARLNADGSLDTGFNPNLSGLVRCISLQTDGKILIAGAFNTVGGTTRQYVARLEAGGALDTSFTPILNGGAAIHAIHQRTDGKIVIGGSFNRLNNVDTRGIGLVTLTGTTDTSFNAEVSGTVQVMTPQVDGRLLIGGIFTKVNDTGRNGFARLNADGSLDPVMNPDFGTGSVSDIALRPDGTMLVSGSFTRVNGVARARFVRLLNDIPTSTFQKVGSTTVRWLRGGSMPLETEVEFEIHQPGQTGWQFVGKAQRVTGGWELADLTLPPAAAFRAQAAIVTHGASYPQTVVFPPFGAAAPGITVRDHAGNTLQSPATPSDFGATPIPLYRDLEFEISNDGLADLANLSFSVIGPAAADFILIVPPQGPVLPTEAVKFRVRFTPTVAGLRQAELRISSNDSAASPFVIPLSGTGGQEFSPVFGNVGEIPHSATSFDVSGRVFGALVLGFAPPEGSVLVAIDQQGTSPFAGTLAGLPDQSFVTADFGGTDYRFLASYRGGSGNDLVFIRVGPGTVDPTYDPRPNQMVHSLALQPDGKVVMCGSFTSVNGVAKSRIARLNPDGSLDPTLNVSMASQAEGMVVQRDGKILVDFTVTAANGTSRPTLARLNPDGSLDLGFATEIVGSVHHALELRSGKILIGGTFSKVGTTTKSNIALLNSDGSLDASFTASIPGTPVYMRAMEELPDGKILIGGSFLTVNSVSRNFLARLNASGTLDTSFAPVLGPTTGSEIGVTSFVAQPDGKVIVGGYFTSASGVPRNRLVRLNADGSLDPGFQANLSDRPFTLLLQADGKVILCGILGRVNGEARSGIARLHADGSLDPSFNPRQMTALPTFASMVMQADGTLLVAGNFSTMNGIGSGGLARLTAGPIVSNVEVTGEDTVTWNRSGALAELREAAFEVSTNLGATWAPLGVGTRTAAGWAINGATLPEQGHIRAKGLEAVSSRASALITETGLFGRSPTALEQWRDLHFGTTLEEGPAGKNADGDRDGLVNSLEFAFGLDPFKDSSGQLPAWTRVNGAYEVAFPTPVGVAGVIYGAEWSETLDNGNWQPAQDLSSGGMHVFRVPTQGKPALFFRLKVTP